MQMDIKYRASVQQQVQEAETQREAMRLQVRREDTQMRTDTQAHDTVIDSQTKLEIEHLKAQLALVLAQMDMRSLKLAGEEAIERGI
jgi:hypothetical protein